jgi:hypothetical protein
MGPLDYTGFKVFLSVLMITDCFKKILVWQSQIESVTVHFKVSVIFFGSEMAHNLPKIKSAEMTRY